MEYKKDPSLLYDHITSRTLIVIYYYYSEYELAGEIFLFNLRDSAIRKDSQFKHPNGA